MERFDVVIVGAGAAGMMCAAEAGRRGRRVLVLEHNRTPGEKIRISGGGRCNFTNIDVTASAFLSENPRFSISALKRFSQWNIIDRLDRRGISWHEKTLGQLFCDGPARQIVEMLTDEMAKARVRLWLQREVNSVEKSTAGFTLKIGDESVSAASLVVASGGKSIPKIGASGFGYDVAAQFGLKIVDTRPALVPLTFTAADLAQLKPLAGISTRAAVSCNGARFEEGLLITHRGLSGPSILQVSSYWREGDEISVDLLPAEPSPDYLKRIRREKGGQRLERILADIMPKRLAHLLAAALPAEKNLADLTDLEMSRLAGAISNWRLKPAGSEGYRTAEVTLGGVSTEELNAKSLEARKVPGLYFIGEVVDVTGWLGGYNFQWAWSSGWAAGQVV